MLFRQTMTKGGLVEGFGMLNIENKGIEYQINMTFDKSGDMNQLVALEYIPKNKIAKEALKKMENMAADMKIGRMDAENKRPIPLH